MKCCFSCVCRQSLVKTFIRNFKYITNVLLGKVLVAWILQFWLAKNWLLENILYIFQVYLSPFIMWFRHNRQFWSVIYQAPSMINFNLNTSNRCWNLLTLVMLQIPALITVPKKLGSIILWCNKLWTYFIFKQSSLTKVSDWC